MQFDKCGDLEQHKGKGEGTLSLSIHTTQMHRITRVSLFNLWPNCPWPKHQNLIWKYITRSLCLIKLSMRGKMAKGIITSAGRYSKKSESLPSVCSCTNRQFIMWDEVQYHDRLFHWSYTSRLAYNTRAAQSCGNTDTFINPLKHQVHLNNI
jgi:hypothetical protein